MENQRGFLLNMDSTGHVAVPLRNGGKKMRKRKELDALAAHSLAKRAYSNGKRNIAGTGLTSNDQLLSQSTDDQEEYTWTKVRSGSRCRGVKRLSLLRTCGPFLLITCMLLSLGFVYWLYFDIREQIADYRIRIEQVTATSQNVPDALQKWHETTKNLEQNHSMLLEHIAELQKKILSISSDVDQLKEQVSSEQKDTTQDEHIQTLQADLVDLGAKMKGFEERVSKLDADMGGHELYFNTTLDQLRQSIEKVLNRPVGQVVDNTTQLRLDDFDKTLNQRIEALFQNFTVEGEQLRVRIGQLEQQFSTQTTQVTLLLDETKNISNHVDVIENNVIANLTKQFDNFDTKTSNLTAAFNMLQNRYVAYVSQYTKLAEDFSALRNQVQGNSQPPQVRSESSSSSIKDTEAEAEAILALNPNNNQGLYIEGQSGSNTNKKSVIEQNNLNSNDKQSSQVSSDNEGSISDTNRAPNVNSAPHM